MPRPTRTLRMREPAGGCKVASENARRSLDADEGDAGVAGLCWPRLRGRLAVFFAILLLHHFHEMPDLVNHAANGRGVLTLDHLMQAPQAEAADRLAHIISAADKADYPLDFHAAG